MALGLDVGHGHRAVNRHGVIVEGCTAVFNASGLQLGPRARGAPKASCDRRRALRLYAHRRVAGRTLVIRNRHDQPAITLVIHSRNRRHSRLSHPNVEIMLGATELTPAIRIARPTPAQVRILERRIDVRGGGRGVRGSL